MGDEHGGDGGSGVDEDDHEEFRPSCWSFVETGNDGDDDGDDDDDDDDDDGEHDGDDKGKF